MEGVIVTTAIEYCQFAGECVESAARAASLHDKNTWLEMARHWEYLAREAERSSKGLRGQA
jgi:hypothetical protein